MKSFLYEIPEEYMPMHPYMYNNERRIKVMYERDNISEIRHDPDLILMGVNWFAVYSDITREVKRLWEEAKASVDITPGDGCEHSDQMIP